MLLFSLLAVQNASWQETDLFGELPKNILEMEDSRDAKFRPALAFCGVRIKSAGLMPGSGEAITMYYVLGAGLRAVLERC